MGLAPRGTNYSIGLRAANAPFRADILIAAKDLKERLAAHDFHGVPAHAYIRDPVAIFGGFDE